MYWTGATRATEHAKGSSESYGKLIGFRKQLSVCLSPISKWPLMPNCVLDLLLQGAKLRGAMVPLTLGSPPQKCPKTPFIKVTKKYEFLAIFEDIMEFLA